MYGTTLLALASHSQHSPGCLSSDAASLLVYASLSLQGCPGLTLFSWFSFTHVNSSTPTPQGPVVLVSFTPLGTSASWWPPDLNCAHGWSPKTKAFCCLRDAFCHAKFSAWKNGQVERISLVQQLETFYLWTTWSRTHHSRWQRNEVWLYWHETTWMNPKLPYTVPLWE